MMLEILILDGCGWDCDSIVMVFVNFLVERVVVLCDFVLLMCMVFVLMWCSCVRVWRMVDLLLLFGLISEVIWFGVRCRDMLCMIWVWL